MQSCSEVKRLLQNGTNMHELGQQRAFELGNLFYGKYTEGVSYWRKRTPAGEKFLVSIEVV